MYIEIEKKFLILNESWRKDATSVPFCQGYIYSQDGCFVRVRTAGQKAFLTIKGSKHGISRPEFEYSIPLSDAEELLQTMAQKPLIYKVRHNVSLDKHIWEIDEYMGENAGLFVAEIELTSEDEIFTRPTWLGQEVTHDPRYRNAALARCPFSQWDKELRKRLQVPKP